MKRLPADLLPIVLLTGLLSGGCLDGCGGWNRAFERMVDQPSDRAYGKSGFYSDGRAMRTPPGGAITREEIVGAPALTEGLEAGAPVSEFPVPLTAALLARGRDRFDIYCAVCHGVAGDGDSPVAAKMQLRKPPSLHEPRIVALSPGQMYRVILEGYGLMPSHDVQLDIHDRWAVAAYVRALQLSQRVSLASLSEPLRIEAMQALRKQGH